MKKSRKILASLGVVAAVAGVGVMAAGCCEDEFANAKEITYADYAAFQTEAGNQAVNTFDGYEFSLTAEYENTEVGYYTDTKFKIHGVGAKLVEGQTQADMHYTVDYVYDLETIGRGGQVDVTIVNQKVENEYVAMVYVAIPYAEYVEYVKMSFEEFSAEILSDDIMQNLKPGNGEPINDLRQLIAFGYVNIYTTVASFPSQLGQEVVGATYKEVTSRNITRFLIERNDETTQPIRESNKLTLEVSYNKKQIKSVKTSTTMKEFGEDDEVLKSTTSESETKAANPTVQIPENADQYQTI